MAHTIGEELPPSLSKGEREGERQFARSEASMVIFTARSSQTSYLSNSGRMDFASCLHPANGPAGHRTGGDVSKNFSLLEKNIHVVYGDPGKDSKVGGARDYDR